MALWRCMLYKLGRLVAWCRHQSYIPDSALDFIDPTVRNGKANGTCPKLAVSEPSRRWYAVPARHFHDVVHFFRAMRVALIPQLLMLAMVDAIARTLSGCANVPLFFMGHAMMFALTILNHFAPEAVRVFSNLIIKSLEGNKYQSTIAESLKRFIVPGNNDMICYRCSGDKNGKEDFGDEMEHDADDEHSSGSPDAAMQVTSSDPEDSRDQPGPANVPEACQPPVAVAACQHSAAAAAENRDSGMQTMSSDPEDISDQPVPPGASQHSAAAAADNRDSGMQAASRGPEDISDQPAPPGASQHSVEPPAATGHYGPIRVGNNCRQLNINVEVTFANPLGVDPTRGTGNTPSGPAVLPTLVPIVIGNLPYFPTPLGMDSRAPFQPNRILLRGMCRQPHSRSTEHSSRHADNSDVQEVVSGMHGLQISRPLGCSTPSSESSSMSTSSSMSARQSPLKHRSSLAPIESEGSPETSGRKRKNRFSPYGSRSRHSSRRSSSGSASGRSSRLEYEEQEVDLATGLSQLAISPEVDESRTRKERAKSESPPKIAKRALDKSNSSSDDNLARSSAPPKPNVDSS